MESQPHSLSHFIQVELGNKPWFCTLTKKQKQTIEQPLQSLALAYTNPDEARYAITTQLHYLTPESFHTTSHPLLPMDTEIHYIKNHYPKSEAKTDTHWITPEELHQETIRSVPCIDCKKTNVFIIPRQTRAADEAGSLHFQCNDCGRSWVTRGK